MSNVTHPKHYNSGKIEVIEAIEDWKLGFHLGNAVKYISRAGNKDPAKIVEDLEKAIWYIQREIELKKDNPCRPNDMNPTPDAGIDGINIINHTGVPNSVIGEFSMHTCTPGFGHAIYELKMDHKSPTRYWACRNCNLRCLG